MRRSVRLFLALFLLPCFVVSGQNHATPPSTQSEPAESAGVPTLSSRPVSDRRVVIVVQVTDKSGAPVRGLQAQDFTLLDDNQPQKLVSFQAVNAEVPAAADPPVEVVLVVDAVNTPFQAITYERDEIKKFLLQNGGKLARPLSLVMFTEAGTKVNGSSRDGNAIAQVLEKSETGLRSGDLTNGGYHGAAERMRISLDALTSIVTYAKAIPGRKLMIWIGPGWPLFSQMNSNLTSKQADHLFDVVVTASTTLRQAHTTLYSVDQLGPSNNGGVRLRYYENFLKAVKSPSQVLPGDLGVQVLATQSGGRVLNSSNQLGDEIQNSVADAGSFYVLSFNSLPADHADEYHALQVTINKPGMITRTSTGYYNQR
jgi:VWFA-related protein